MDTLSVKDILQREIPFLRTIIESLPTWAWVVLIWLVLNFLLKPYIDAILRRYQHLYDTAVLKTPLILKRIIIEIFRIILISGQLPVIIIFLFVPKKRRFRVFRKNEITYYIWLLSKKFPSRTYYRRIRSWFEHTVYLNKETSYIHPEPLKEDGNYISEMLAKDIVIEHKEFCEKYKEKGFIKTVRVGIALKKLNPSEWVGKKLFFLWIIFSWSYFLLFILSFYYLFTKNINGLFSFGLGYILFKFDRYILTKRIINFARKDKHFYLNAVRERVLQFHW